VLYTLRLDEEQEERREDNQNQQLDGGGRRLCHRFFFFLCTKKDCGFLGLVVAWNGASDATRPHFIEPRRRCMHSPALSCPVQLQLAGVFTNLSLVLFALRHTSFDETNNKEKGFNTQSK
jgi:hypothetical protein